MAEKIVFALQKGGVGKTTSTVVTAKILAAAGYKVLVVDFDAQGNATLILTGGNYYCSFDFTGQTIMEAVEDGNVEKYIVHLTENLDLIPADDNLAVFSRYIYTADIERPSEVLKRLLSPVEAKYDFIFVDVGPELGDKAVNAIAYADHIIVPVDCGDLSMDALVRFMNFLETFQKVGHTEAEVTGILLTMKDGRPLRYERDVSEGIRNAYGDLVFKTEIRRRVKIKEMSAAGVDVSAVSMDDYAAFTEEILERIKGGKDES